MREQAATTYARHQRAAPANWFGKQLRGALRAYPFSARLAFCFLAIVASVVLVGDFGSDGASGNILWISNGLMLAYLLLAPRWRWPAYLCVSFAAIILGSFLIHESWKTNLLYNALDMIEVLVGALLLRPRSTVLPQFTNGGYLLRFIAYASVAGPLLSAVIVAWVESSQWHGTPFSLLVGWVTADGLGTAVACPIFVVILQTHFRSTGSWRRQWPSFAIFVVVTLGVFSQAKGPDLYLIYPALVVVLLRLGLGWAGFASLFAGLTGGWCTLHGRGPLAAAGLPMSTRSHELQIFLALGMFMLYSISVVLESRRSIERKLARIASLHALVTENSRDAIMMTDFSGQRSYISAAFERLLGWPPEEFARFKTLELIHPDDLAGVVSTLQTLRAGQEGELIECRARTARGDYVWLEVNLRLVRDPETGNPTGFLNMIRDITDRKQAERSREFHHSIIKAIQEVSPEGILVVDRNHKVVSLNRRFLDIWEIRAEDGEVDPVQAAIDGPDRFLAQSIPRVKDAEGFLNRIRELYADPTASDQCEIELLDGRTLERYSAGVLGKAGSYLGRVWFFRDISERKIAHERLQNAYKTVETLAATDALTGLANRRRFEEVLNNEWRRGLRDRRPLALLMIDADRFKLYNDTYGHPRGDNCLKQIAEAAQDVVGRPGDLVARYGGEEFAVILPNTDSEGAMLVANEICRAMRMRQLPHSGGPSGIVTVSVGCSVIVPAFGRHAANLVELADAALYEAKHRGRNQACDSSEALSDREGKTLGLIPSEKHA